MTRLNTGLLCILLSAMGLMSTFAHATSFDCTKASTFAEIQICNTPHLERLDEQLNSAYVAGLTFSLSKDQYRADQRAWLKHRDTCATQACVKETMEARLKALDRTPAARKVSHPQRRHKRSTNPPHLHRQ